MYIAETTILKLTTPKGRIFSNFHSPWNALLWYLRIYYITFTFFFETHTSFSQEKKITCGCQYYFFPHSNLNHFGRTHIRTIIPVLTWFSLVFVIFFFFVFGGNAPQNIKVYTKIMLFTIFTGEKKTNMQKIIWKTRNWFIWKTSLSLFYNYTQLPPLQLW